MTSTGWSIAAAPLLPWWALAVFAAAAIALLGLGLWRGAPGLGWRAAAIAVLLAALVNPSLIEEERVPQRDVAIIMVDDSPSQSIGNLQQATAGALAVIKDRLAHRRDIDLRVIHAAAPQPGGGDEGTRLFTALDRALSDVPRQRLAGIMMITDGEVHDVPPGDAKALRQAVPAPLHVLLSGEPNERDRRLVCGSGGA